MLKLNDITCGYTLQNPALKNISVNFATQKINVLIGPNGAGKSTLLKTISGFLKPHSGEVLFNNKNLIGLTSTERAESCYLLESESHLTFSITLSELLSLHRTKSVNNSVKNLALEKLDLIPFLNRDLTELSSGERHRALIAHALTSESKVVLLDEPFVHLDWAHQSRLADTLKYWMNTFNTTFVLALHELDWATRLASNVILLHQGKVMLQGPPGDVFTSSVTREVFAFKSVIDQNPIDGSQRLTLG